jgi:hypothetical protein
MRESSSPGPFAGEWPCLARHLEAVFPVQLLQRARRPLYLTFSAASKGGQKEAKEAKEAKRRQKEAKGGRKDESWGNWRVYQRCSRPMVRAWVGSARLLFGLVYLG